MTGKLIVFAAPSGAGKTTIVQHILEQHPEFDFSISATTRSCRDYEEHGKHYFFISEEEFVENIDKGNFIEWERFYDYYYGTLKSYIDKKIKEGKTIVFDIDVMGAVNIKKQYPNHSVLVFVKPPSISELKNRLIKRNTETNEDLAKRIERAELELTYETKFDKVVLNDDLDSALKSAEKIIEEVI